MKIEKLLLGLFASFLMVGCSQNDDSPNSGEQEDKNSYLAINIKSTYDMSSRTTDNDFVDGTPNENAVNKVHFFFFDGHGAAFDVSGDTPEAVKGFGNYVIVDNPTLTDDTQNAHIEKLINAIVVIHTKDHKYPASVVAVLNWDYAAQESLSLAQLKSHLTQQIYQDNQGTKTNFLMSNSVYVNSGLKEATPLNTAHFAASDQMALDHPVDIYVERLAVKVHVDVEKENNADYKEIGGKPALKANGVSLTTDHEADNAVYAQILAWDLNTTISQSYLVKHVDAAWETTPPFANWTDWNEAAKHRSYWGIGAHDANGTTFQKSFKWSDIPNSIPSSDYCMENTSTDNSTNILVKGQLVDAEGKHISVAQFLGSYYKQDTGADKWSSLRQAVAEALKDKLFCDVNGTKTTIQSSDIKLVAGHKKYPTDAHEYYKVYFELCTNTTGYGTQRTGGWFDADKTTALTNEQVNAKMAQLLLPAKMWYDGATYYFTRISHFGYQDAVIRNHYYQVQIEKVQGLGTPVNNSNIDDPEDPNPPIIPEPVDPSDTESFIAAKINVLSWRLNSYNVILGQ